MNDDNGRWFRGRRSGIPTQLWRIIFGLMAKIRIISAQIKPNAFYYNICRMCLVIKIFMAASLQWQYRDVIVVYEELAIVVAFCFANREVTRWYNKTKSPLSNRKIVIDSWYQKNYKLINSREQINNFYHHYVKVNTF